MSTDLRSMLHDDLPERLERHLAVDLPAHVADGVDRRMDVAIRLAAGRSTGAGEGHARRRPGRRTIAILAVAAILAAAATPGVRQLFDGWGEEFDRVFALSTPIDQSVVDDGYRVTLVRAYADPTGLRLAMFAEDTGDHEWVEVSVGSPSVTDDEGRVYPMTEAHGGGHTSTSTEGWLRFSVPPEAAAGTQRLKVTLDAIPARRADPPDATAGFAYETLWTSVPGRWEFEFDLEFLGAQTMHPNVSARVGDVTVTIDELTVTPAATVGRLTFSGLPVVDPDWGWDPSLRVDHDGEVSVHMLSPGFVQDGLVFEAVPGYEDLSGTWTITIDEFHRGIPNPDSNEVTESESIEGPWVLTFEGPTGDAP